MSAHLTHDEVIERLRDHIAMAGSQIAMAQKTGVARSTISNVLAGRRKISPEVLRAIGVRRTMVYVVAK